LDEFAYLTKSPNWTFVFATLKGDDMVDCGSVAKEKGYKIEIFTWNKIDLLGKSHSGGARQSACCEYVVVVYKHAAGTGTGNDKHYSLMNQREALVSDWLIVCGRVLFLIFE